MPDVSRIGVGVGEGGGTVEGGEEEAGKRERERERMGEHVARVIYFYVFSDAVRFN